MSAIIIGPHKWIKLWVPRVATAAAVFDAAHRAGSTAAMLHGAKPLLYIEMPRCVQPRTFFEFRNKGYVLTHFLPAFRVPKVVDTYDDLLAYHHEAFRYQLLSRPTYNIRTYELELELIASSRRENAAASGSPSRGVEGGASGGGGAFHSPFASMDSLLPAYKFEFKIPEAKRSIIKHFRHYSPYGLPGLVTMRFDGLLSNDRMSAFITSVSTANGASLTRKVVEDFVNHCLFARYALRSLGSASVPRAWRLFNTTGPFQMHLGFDRGFDAPFPAIPDPVVTISEPTVDMAANHQYPVDSFDAMPADASLMPLEHNVALDPSGWPAICEAVRAANVHLWYRDVDGTFRLLMGP